MLRRNTPNGSALIRHCQVHYSLQRSVSLLSNAVLIPRMITPRLMFQHHFGAGPSLTKQPLQTAGPVALLWNHVTPVEHMTAACHGNTLMRYLYLLSGSLFRVFAMWYRCPCFVMGIKPGQGDTRLLLLLSRCSRVDPAKDVQSVSD